MSKYSITSPYAFTPIVNNEYLDILEPRTIPINSQDLPYIIESQFHLRPDLASNEIYKTPKLWWVFSQRNFNILKDPVFDFKAGTEIMICEPKTLFSFLGL
tara:strand:+ start:369 stop:671 length:303 start_codon:yes stop_codon:yes gene_type:complete